MSYCNLFSMGAFNILNQRNHPELEWKQFETKHFQIIYHDPLYNVAIESAKVAENSYNSLQKTYQFTPNKKIKIYISDQDEIVNGGVVLTYYIFIWVNQNDFTRLVTGDDKWLRKVIAHELSHYFLFNSISGWLWNFIPLNALLFPSDINEGYAQFFSGEVWGFNRGDRYLRKAVFSDKLDYNLKFFESSHLMYAKGFSMVRYLHSFYGEEKLIELLKYRNKMGLFSFKKAFKKVYKKDFSEFEEEWRKYIYTYYYGSSYEVKNQKNDKNSFDYTLNALTDVELDLSRMDDAILSDNYLLFYGRKDSRQNYRDLVLFKISIDSLNNNKIHIEDEIKIIRSISLKSYASSKDHQYVTYARNTRHKYGSLAPSVYLFNIKTKRRIKIGRGNYSQVTNSGIVFYQKLEKNFNCIYRWENGISKPFLNFNPDSQIGGLALNKDDTILSISLFDENRKFKILNCNISSKKILLEKEFSAMPIKLYWNDQNYFYVLVETLDDSHTSLFEYNTFENQWLEYETPTFNIYPIQITHNEDIIELITLADLIQDQSKLGKLTLSSKPKFEKQQSVSNHYTKWIDTKPDHPIIESDSYPEVFSQKEYNTLKNISSKMLLPIPFPNQLFLYNIWSEPLGKHIFQLLGLFPYNLNIEDFEYTFNYQNNCLYPTIDFTHLKTIWFAGIWEDKEFYEILTRTSLSSTIPVDFINNPFWNILYGFELAHSDVEMKDTDFNVEPYFEDGSVITASIFTYLEYNLPYKNYRFHPIRRLFFNYKLTGANKKLMMKKNFTNHRFIAQLAFAPFFELTNNYFLKMISFQNLIYYEKVIGKSLIQYQPGMDEYGYITINENALFHRRYIRGYGETRIASAIFQMQNEIWFKIIDDFKLSINFNSPILSVGYLGIGGWIDYSKLWNTFQNNNQENGNDVEFKAFGGEIKVNINIFSIPTIHKIGKAYDFKKNDLGYYYQLEIPIGMVL